METYSNRAAVVPVAAVDALAWAYGSLTDADLLIRSPLVPQAVFVVWVPTQWAWRDALRQIRHWRELGAVCLITRTGNLDRIHHLQVAGARKTLRETFGNQILYRFIQEPRFFHKYFDDGENDALG